ncbi:DUF4241 domain-containing protein [Bacillus sp. FSL M8-0166]|uniref:DUF4241 domain-containing protein n=1 Tax=Bacillus sp. FSL M8-0166 TaxID=2954575 RepID=UPI0030F55D58
MYNINPTHLLYRNGETTNSQEGDQLFAKQLGYIEITSGHIVACDPFVSEGDQSFTRKVALGKYPILLVVKRLESGDERVAYSMIKFTNEQLIEWELATKAGQEINQLKEDNDFYLYEEFEERLRKTTSTHGTGLSPVFMTKWTLPCLQQASVMGCTQAFGG